MSTKNPRGAGRPKGSTNKSTEMAKRILTEFIGKNMNDMEDLFEQLKAEDPKKAFDVLYSGLEYVLPKLARTEYQALDKNGEKADPSVEVKFVKPEQD